MKSLITLTLALSILNSCGIDPSVNTPSSSGSEEVAEEYVPTPLNELINTPYIFQGRYFDELGAEVLEIDHEKIVFRFCNVAIYTNYISGVGGHLVWESLDLPHHNPERFQAGSELNGTHYSCVAIYALLNNHVDTVDFRMDLDLSNRFEFSILQGHTFQK